MKDPCEEEVEEAEEILQAVVDHVNCRCADGGECCVCRAADWLRKRGSSASSVEGPTAGSTDE